jgi:biopolymer transport protein ExbB/TolQ
MKITLTLQHLLGIMSIIIIPLIIWGISVETRFSNSIYRIEQNEKKNTAIEKKIDKISENTQSILIQIERLKVK